MPISLNNASNNRCLFTQEGRLLLPRTSSCKSTITIIPSNNICSTSFILDPPSTTDDKPLSEKVVFGRLWSLFIKIRYLHISLVDSQHCINPRNYSVSARSGTDPTFINVVASSENHHRIIWFQTFTFSVSNLAATTA
ncbi:unnamed protein product [Lactuca saligna]|uniref:Uncharacterized protein n=1 Tax=Lactuca saligna TaxID=75948 RepID=A0AA36EPR9_LACSI|nr:unnamed protein product [Lactuca saligna]